ncbi:MAG: hypothetical protein ACYS1A_03950 [Planctomycetota bacterium]|jgi:Tfp pilus assembly protein PilF
MPEEDIAEILAKAGVFFERARRLGKATNFDDAIEAYLEGLRFAPEALEMGHIELRELGLLRQTKGGQRPSEEEKKQRLQGKTPLDQMINAEYLLAKDPGHLPYAETMLRAAVAGSYKKTAKWIADLIFLANNAAKKPSLPIYLLLKDSYLAIDELERAVAAGRNALRLKPGDAKLFEQLKSLSQGWQTAKINGVKNMPNMPEKEIEPALAKAVVFFEKAQKIAETGNFDYAIDLYLEGLRYNPDALEQGHLRLFELALNRQKKGGKKPTMVEKVKHLRGKNILEQMLNAEYLFAKDPNHLPYAEAMLKAAVEAGYTKTAKWIADLTFQTNNAAAKPSFQVYVLLKESYAALELYERAIAACGHAAKLRPENAEIADDYKRLSAEMTVAKGGYDLSSDFRHSIKDRQSQEKLQAQQKVVKTEDYRVTAVKRARKAMAQEPDLPGNIFNLAGALSDLENDKGENEAMELLENVYKTKKDFSYRQRAGLIKLKQLRRKVRQAKSTLESSPGDARARSRLSEFSTLLNSSELEHYRLCMENYPTDLQAKYEYGIRLFRNKQYDQAIPLFQEAQRDPRRRVSAMDRIGLCFFAKGWFTDAIDIFSQAINSHELKEDAIAKELRYNLARSHQENGDTEKALDIYRKLAQLDFAYKDVRQRVDQLRNKGE